MENAQSGKDENLRIRKLIELDKNTLPPDGGSQYNRLIFASSPYLLQHADNPVDWFPWGDEAFAKAALENKPVMVSIGYATCHWCHVMEHESFEDPQVAELINRHVIPVKVDREERPDIDSLYMKAARMLIGTSAGWPLNIFLTPERKPFFAATYMPKTYSNGKLGVGDTLAQISEFWQTRRELIDENSENLVRALSEKATSAAGEIDYGALLGQTLTTLVGMYDPINGGFGQAAKFPLPHYLSFLLRVWIRSGNTDAEEMVAFTLRMMRDGGIFDQLGYGFHRYSVDPEWLIPHFEKMLCDQALIAMTYLEAYQAFGDPYLKETALEIFDFVQTRMTSPEGGFYSGLDADSEGQEGRYYLWTSEEIAGELDQETARLFCQLFEVSPSGNFEGSNILHQPRSVAAVARENGITADQLTLHLADARTRLLEKREKRIMPFRDEKVLTSWNGLMIGALARGGAVTGEPRLLQAARAAVRFIGEKLRSGSGRLLRSSHRGDASVPAFLEDYAFLCWGMIELYQAGGEPSDLEQALGLAREMLELFHDDGDGGFFDTASDADQVLVRMKSFYDGSVPSGNSIACLSLLRLGMICSDETLKAVGERGLHTFMGSALAQPVAHLQLVNALDFFLGPNVEITLVGDRSDPAMIEMLASIHGRFIPGLVLRFRDGDDPEGHHAIDGRPTAYLCTQMACRPAVNSPEDLENMLAELL